MINMEKVKDGKFLHLFLGILIGTILLMVYAKSCNVYR